MSNFKKQKKQVLSMEFAEGGAKLPPQALDLEEVVLGAMLLEKEAIEAVISTLTSESFYKDANGQIFAAILAIYKRNEPVDILTVTKELNKTGELEKIGGSYYISTLTDRVASSANIVFHAHVLLQKQLLRDLIRINTGTIKEAYDDSVDVFELYARQEQLMDSCLDGVMKYESKSIGDTHADSIMEHLHVLKHGNLSGVPTGFRHADRFLGGWQKSDLIVIGARPGMGKAQPLFSKILTPNGFTTFEKIQVGDNIMNSQGKISKVTGKFPQGRKYYYKITFDDGTFTHCCKEHLWETKTRKERKNKYNASVKNTEEIAASLRVNKDNRLNHSVRFVKPIQFPKKKLSLDPYLLGVIIGDLACTRMSIMNPENSLIEKIRTKLPSGDTINKQKSTHTYGIVGKNTIQQLRKLGLKETRSHEKFIPEIYLNASIQQRVELLQGLMDTDGYVVGGYQIEYSTTSEQLAKDIHYLVLSLGGRCTYKQKQGTYMKSNEKIICKKYYRMNISFYNDIVPISSEKHLKKFKKNKTRFQHKFIQDIELVGKTECVCISTSATDKLYITDDFILTHNTSLVVSFATNAAVEFKKPVAIFSLEMSAKQLTDKIQSSISEIDLELIIKKRLTEDQIRQMDAACQDLYKAPIYIDDTPALTLLELKTKARKLVKTKGIELIIIDYLQLMSGGNDSKGNREQEISTISRGLKALAKELNVPIIALSQLSRQVENRPDKKPQLSDLRESGAIEQDADMVMFCYRPQYYDLNEYSVGNEQFPAEGLFALIIAKNRHGSLGDIILGWVPKYTKLTNYDFVNKQPEHRAKNIIAQTNNNFENSKENDTFVQPITKFENNVDFLSQKPENVNNNENPAF